MSDRRSKQMLAIKFEPVALVLLSQKDIKRKPLENQIKVEIRAAARRRLG